MNWMIVRSEQRAESEVVGLVHTQGLPGRNVDGEWRFRKAPSTGWKLLHFSPFSA